MGTQIIQPPTPIKCGMMLPWPNNTPPSGWLLCYGQAVSRINYSRLFNRIGTLFGVGDGTTTFNVPDYRGRVPLGMDNMGGSSANRVTSGQADTIGGNAGAETHTLITAEMPSHAHMEDGVGGPCASGAGVTSVLANNQWTGNTGGDGAHNNMQPYLTMNYIIKT